LSWLPGFIAHIAQWPLVDLGVERGGLEQPGDAADIEDEDAVGAHVVLRNWAILTTFHEVEIFYRNCNTINSQDAGIESESFR
jgi:hypothetical protein